MKHLDNIHTVELEDLRWKDLELSKTCQEFMEVLYRSPGIVSMELSNIDPTLIALLTKNLPSSVKRLSIGRIPANRTPRGIYTFPSEVHLVNLFLENCLLRIDSIFEDTNFPNLKKLSMKEDSLAWEETTSFQWEAEDVQSLVVAVQTGRMPKLEKLSIRDSTLRGRGLQLVDLLKSKNLWSVELVSVQLSSDDGNIFLRNIQEGHLDHLESFNLLFNKDLDPLVFQLKTASKQRGINLEINPAPHQSPDEVESTLTTLVSSSVQTRPGTNIPETSGRLTMAIGSLLTTFPSLAGQQPPSQSSEGSTMHIGSLLTTLLTAASQQPASQSSEGSTMDIRSLLTTLLTAVNQQPASQSSEETTTDIGLLLTTFLTAVNQQPSSQSSEGITTDIRSLLTTLLTAVNQQPASQSSEGTTMNIGSLLTTLLTAANQQPSSQSSEGTTMNIGSLLTTLLNAANQQPSSQSSEGSTDAEATESSSLETTTVDLPSHQPQQKRKFDTVTEANEFIATSAVPETLTSKESKDEVRNTKYRRLEQQFIH